MPPVRFAQTQAHLLGVTLRAAQEGPADLSDRYAVLCLQQQQLLQTQLQAQLPPVGVAAEESGEVEPGRSSGRQAEEARAKRVQAALVDAMEAAGISARLECRSPDKQV